MSTSIDLSKRAHAADHAPGGAADLSAIFTPDPTDKTLLPFTPTSPWRLGVASTATFTDGTDPRDTAMANVDGAGQAWVNADSNSHPVSYGLASDPLATVTDTAHGNATYQENIPADARIAAGGDADMHVVTPDRRFILEHFGASRVDSTHYNVLRRVQVDLSGSGVEGGVRAYGGSAIGGLIRTWEIDPTHPAYTGRIAHPLAIALRPEQLFDDGTGGGFVWPATAQDGDSATSYTGTIPVGSFFAIPPDVDITALGLLAPEALMVAKAAQDFGVYVTDRSGSTALYVEDDGGTASVAFADALRGDPNWGADLRTIFHALRVVTNNTADTPNGGPVGVWRRGDPLQALGHRIDTLPTSQVDTFTANGTWTKPSWANHVRVVAIGAGGGGGSGARLAAGTASSGGAGGGGGGLTDRILPASALSATVSVTVGNGGNGGAAVTVDGTAGSNGSTGGASSFGSYVRSAGGTGGNGGKSAATATAGKGGQALIFGGDGGTGVNGGGGSGSNGGSAVAGIPGGPGGGGISAANATSGGGGGGTPGGQNLTAGTAGTSPGGNGGNGTDQTAGVPAGGSSGGGGGSSTTGPGGSGGNGGLYGAAGAGGGSSQNGQNSGPGGAGANGIVVVVSYP